MWNVSFFFWKIIFFVLYFRNEWFVKKNKLCSNVYCRYFESMDLEFLNLYLPFSGDIIVKYLQNVVYAAFCWVIVFKNTVPVIIWTNQSVFSYGVFQINLCIVINVLQFNWFPDGCERIGTLSIWIICVNLFYPSYNLKWH